MQVKFRKLTLQANEIVYLGTSNGCRRSHSKTCYNRYGDETHQNSHIEQAEHKYYGASQEADKYRIVWTDRGILIDHKRHYRSGCWSKKRSISLVYDMH